MLSANSTACYQHNMPLAQLAINTSCHQHDLPSSQITISTNCPQLSLLLPHAESSIACSKVCSPVVLKALSAPPLAELRPRSTHDRKIRPCIYATVSTANMCTTNRHVRLRGQPYVLVSDAGIVPIDFLRCTRHDTALLHVEDRHPALSQP